MSSSQKEDMLHVFGKLKGVGNLDYVSAWYRKSAELIQDTTVEVALVSTNSITQGEQVAILWKNLMLDFGIVINFGYLPFVWNSEAKDKAKVHCVIVGLSKKPSVEKKLFDSAGQVNKVNNINGYLIDATNIFVEGRTKPLSPVNDMIFGSMPNDNGYLSNYSDEEKKSIVKKYPKSENFFKRIYGAQEFINNQVRWAVWLYGVSPSEWRGITPIEEAVKNVRDIRLSSNRESTKKLGETPYLFGEIRQPNTEYLLVPSTSSENRKYIPMGFMEKDDISTNANLIIPNATLYDFAILTSNVHMAWMRTVAGRLKSDYRYSAKIVYNNFPWPTVTEEQKQFIANTAQGILDARSLYSECSLADLYHPNKMPLELIKAHQENDKAVMKAYGMIKKVNGRDKLMSASETVARLFEMYQELNEKK